MLRTRSSGSVWLYAPALLTVGAIFFFLVSIGVWLRLSPPLALGAVAAQASQITITEAGFDPAVYTTTVGAPVT